MNRHFKCVLGGVFFGVFGIGLIISSFCPPLLNMFLYMVAILASIGGMAALYCLGYELANRLLDDDTK